MSRQVACSANCVGTQGRLDDSRVRGPIRRYGIPIPGLELIKLPCCCYAIEEIYSLAKPEITLGFSENNL
jgi:hypothetical protein